MAAEAAGGGEAAGAIGGRAAAARSAGRSPAPRRPVTRTPGGIAPAEPGAGSAPPRASAPGASTAQQQPQRRERPQQRQQQRRSRPSSRRGARGSNYQAVILVEFVAAILLTAMTPVATKKNPQGLSPYAGSDIVKLGAITLTYLILAMISVGGRSAGRVAAWLGGLILLTDGLYEASNIARDLQVFSGGGEPKQAPAAPAAGGIFPAPSGQPPLQFGVAGG